MPFAVVRNRARAVHKRIKNVPFVNCLSLSGGYKINWRCNTVCLRICSVWRKISLIIWGKIEMNSSKPIIISIRMDIFTNWFIRSLKIIMSRDSKLITWTLFSMPFLCHSLIINVRNLYKNTSQSLKQSKEKSFWQDRPYSTLFTNLIHLISRSNKKKERWVKHNLQRYWKHSIFP